MDDHDETTDEQPDEALAAAMRERNDWIARYLGAEWQESEPGIFIQQTPGGN